MNQDDERIIMYQIELVQRLLGESSNADCKHCEWPVVEVGRHAPDCPLRRICPYKLGAMKLEAADERIKQAAKKGRGHKAGWNGLPPMKKSLVKRRYSKNRGPGREIKHCRVCCDARLFINEDGVWVCKECNHSRPCEYMPGARNCRRCHPNG